MKTTNETYIPIPEEITLAPPQLPKRVIEHILQLLFIYETDKAYFFGSRVRGLHADFSDYDIAFSSSKEQRYRDVLVESDLRTKYVLDIVLTTDIEAWATFVSGVVEMEKETLTNLLNS